jgi:hypothetical protein
MVSLPVETWLPNVDPSRRAEKYLQSAGWAVFAPHVHYCSQSPQAGMNLAYELPNNCGQ